MAHIKKLVVNGFKSFARKTEIIFDEGISVVIGPNGAGKSNLSDALCFVLGRLSIKSMRAAKAKNLLFMGSKFSKPAQEAYVELVFSNNDRTFAIDKDEIHLTRIVRRNGQSIYKINNETKTRTEVIELLAHAGIDPHGFNMVLQGQIQAIVKMHPEERRKIIEEVAGISIYESRKEKALHELEKSEEKLKEISAILRERSAYLRNLDNERAQALKFKELENTTKKCKASLINKKKSEKEKEIESIVKSINEKTEEKEKIKLESEKKQSEVETLKNKIDSINLYVKKASGTEQEILHDDITNLKALLEGLRVRKDIFTNRKNEIERRISELNKSIPEFEREIYDLREQSPIMERKAQDLKNKKEELVKIEQSKKTLLTLKSELNSIKERIKDKERQLNRNTFSSDSYLKQIEEYSYDLKYKNKKDCSSAILSLRKELAVKKNLIKELEKEIFENKKNISINELEITRAEKIKQQVHKIDTCPLCLSKITEEHVAHVFRDSDEKIKVAKENLEKFENEIKNLNQNYNFHQKEINSIEENINYSEKEFNKHSNLEEKNRLLKVLVEEENILKKEIAMFEERRKNLEQKIPELSNIETKYDYIMLEIEEISSRTEDNLDQNLVLKERELENTKNIISRSEQDFEEITLDIEEISETIKEKSKILELKIFKEKELEAKFNKMFSERDKLQKDIQEINLEVSEIQNIIRQIEDQVNYLRIGKAKLDAENEALEMEMSDYIGIELLQGSINFLEEKLVKSQEALRNIGSINMRALEVYDEVKKDYDSVEEKVNKLRAEKEDILKIIAEIDHKKKREFVKTFKAMNEIFTNNFAQLSSKGAASLELENPENIFDGGVTISVKLAKGKYFDVTSLSGGEQTLVALSLLFAIQEYKPYHFYIFDEIDAALDKRNSERLAGLLNRYMKSGQYIVITHNDALIYNANVLYGVSMQEGMSKIISLKLNEENSS